MKEIFISHNTQDKNEADVFVDFLISVGIQRDSIFCSSLPGNNVKEKIPDEIRESLNKSKVNVIILSKAYYESVYCLNEAGIIWYKNASTIILGLPEITIENMKGFIDSDYMIRHINSPDDIFAIIDDIASTLKLPVLSHQVINKEAAKLVRNYNVLLDNRRNEASDKIPSKEIDFENISTDDEKIILYYLIAKELRKTSQKDVLEWLQKKELFNVDVNNGFDLLSFLGESKYENEIFELDINYFRKFISQKEDFMASIRPILLNHFEKVANKFIILWQRNVFNDEMKLFLLYIIDNKISKLGNRWKADFEINSLSDWVNDNSLPITIPNNYNEYLNILISNKLVFESDWTSYGNPREYTFYNSLQNFLFDKNFPYYSELQNLKQISEIPF